MPPGTGGSILPPPTGMDCANPEYTPQRIWRISDDQYVTAISDLLGVQAPAITTVGSSKAGFVDYAELLQVTSALTTDIRNSAESVARSVVLDLPKLLACAAGQPQPACIDAFIDRFTTRAFRRPIEAAERTELKALYTNGATDSPAKGLEMVISAILQAPSFVYRTELGKGAVEGKPVELTPYELASSLSFFLLHSIPDPELWKTAEDGTLARSDVFKRQVERLLALPRVQDNLARVHVKWVGLGDGIDDDLAVKYKELTPDLKASMEQETGLFFKSLLTKGGTLSDVLTSNKGFVDQRLATHYGLPGTGRNATFTEATYPAAERAGILTQAAILARYSHHHPIVLRGKYVRDELLCGELPSPPNDPEIEMENTASASLPEREQATRRLMHRICGSCHRLMDPIGLSFMQYDGLARYKPTVNGQPVDGRGTLTSFENADVPVMNAVDMAGKLAASKSVRACIEQKIFGYALGRMTGPTDKCELSRIDAHVQAQGGRLSELVAGIAYSSAFRFRTGTGGK